MTTFAEIIIFQNWMTYDLLEQESFVVYISCQFIDVLKYVK